MGHVACMTVMRNVCNILVENLKRDHSEHLDRQEDKIKMYLWETGLEDTNGFIWQPTAGSCEHNYELWGSIQAGKFHWLSKIVTASNKGLCSMGSVC